MTIRDIILAHRERLLEELAECDRFLGNDRIQYVSADEPPQAPAPVEAVNKPSYLPAPRIEHTPLPMARPRSATATPEEEAALRAQRNLDRMLTPGTGQPIIHTRTNPATGAVERIP